MTAPELPDDPDRYSYLPRPYDIDIAASVSQFYLRVDERSVRINHLEGLLDANKWGRAAELAAWIEVDLDGPGDPDSIPLTTFLAQKIPGLSSARTVRGIIRVWMRLSGQPRPHKGARGIRTPNRKFPTTAEIDAMRTPREFLQETADAIAGALDAAAADRADTLDADGYNAERIEDAMIEPLDRIGTISDQLVESVAALDFRAPYDNPNSATHAAGPLVWPIYAHQAQAVLAALAEASARWDAARAAVWELFSRSGFVDVVDGTVSDTPTPAAELERMRRELESSRNPDGSRRVPPRAPGSTGAKDAIREMARLGQGPWTTAQLAGLLRVSRQTAHAACEALVREGVLGRTIRENRSGGNLYGRPSKTGAE